MMSSVAPLAGAWIEIERSHVVKASVDVAPLAGAWIEIFYVLPEPSLCRRSPRGSVD